MFFRHGIRTRNRRARKKKATAEEPQHCYVCKQKYSLIHHFYDQLCPPCAELNFQKRTELADLRGRVALLTGGRVKIGYYAGLKLLRSGAQLIVTTRFPRDSAQRYGREPDFAEWSHRLQIVGLDLRYPPGVEALCHHLLDTLPRLDFIVNNACQTVRRPPEFYAHMMEGERAAQDVLPPAMRRLLIPIQRFLQPNGLSYRYSPGISSSKSICSPKGISIRTCSRWTCGSEIRGGS